MKKNKLILFGLLIFIVQVSAALSQENRLFVNQSKEFSLDKSEEKVLTLELKKDDFAAVSVKEKNNKSVVVTLASPTGKKLLDNVYGADFFPFIAGESGIYTITVKADKDSENAGKFNYEISYTNVFKLPRTAQLQRQRKINGYDAKVFNVNDDEAIATYFLLEKNGKLKAILRGDSVIGGGFQFPDDPKLWDYPAGKKSAALFRTTLDKTGDGTANIAVQEYSGGAHCCTTMYFFELGEDFVRETAPVIGADSDIIATGKSPTGGLLLQTGDSNFAYWLTSFAGSPIPTVILSFKNGEFRPDLTAMSKPAPALAVLRRKAAAARKNMDLSPYEGAEKSSFIHAFWGEMLDLLYSGNETAAWQYFDLVWDKRKPGKERFKSDFLQQLNESDYWRMMQEDKK